MPRKKKQPVRLEFGRAQLNGSKLNCLVTALGGDATLHMNSFNLFSDTGRAKFLDNVEGKAKECGVDAKRASLDAEIMEYARNALLGLVDVDGSAAGRDGIDPTQLLAAFGITVLGEHDDQSIRCWSANTQKTFVIKSPANWKEAEVLQCVGPKAAAHLWLGSDGKSSEDSFTLTELQRALALAAAEAPRISASKIIGQGVWPHGDRYLIVDGAVALVYDDSKFTRLTKPTIAKKIIELDASKEWHGRIVTSVRGMNAGAAKALLQGLVKLLNAWNWTHRWDARLVAALVFATFIQPVWHWRPLISITGRSDSGKTSLFKDLLAAVFLDWALVADRSTEAGLRQAIGHSAAPVLIDEFDKYQHRQRVLELFRTSSRGGKVLRGTADQSGQQFQLYHIGWFAAIESGAVWGPDRNRFIPLELLLPGNRGLQLPNKSELAELGRELAAAAIWAGPRAVQLADVIKASRFEGVHGRLIESFSVPAAMFAVLWHGREATDAHGRAVLELMLRGRQHLEVQGESDELQLLRDVLAANVRVSVRESGSNISKDLSIGQLLVGYESFQSDLEAKGVRVIQQRADAGQSLFIAHDIASRFLLKGTRWEQSRIDQILLRLPGAERSQQRCGVMRPQGVLFPWPLCRPGPHGQDANQTT